jgi:hypothetical protein
MNLLTSICLFAIGFIFGERRGRADPQTQLRALPSGSGTGVSTARAAGSPGPLMALVGFMKQDRIPPPLLVDHAIAEAKLIGQHDLAHDIAHAFGSPAASSPSRPPVAPPAPTAPPQIATSTRDNRHEHDEHEYEHERERDREHAERRREHRLEREVELEREIIADQTAQMAAQQAAQSTRPPTPTPSIIVQMPSSGDGDDQGSSPSDGYPDDGSTAPDGSDGSDGASSSGSPLPGISIGAWTTYRRALEREPADFDSGRRVGRYALRKDRLRELGCNPDLLISHPRALDLQDAALAIDAADSAKHLAASGALDDHLGRSIAVSAGDAPRVITLSGILGVAQIAGLEGCIGWLEDPSDRKRFPYTSEMFTRTNGVF